MRRTRHRDSCRYTLIARLITIITENSSFRKFLLILKFEFLLILLPLFYQSTPSCLKVRGGWGVVAAHLILVSAQVPMYVYICNNICMLIIISVFN